MKRNNAMAYVENVKLGQIKIKGIRGNCNQISFSSIMPGVYFNISYKISRLFIKISKYNTHSFLFVILSVS